LIRVLTMGRYHQHVFKGLVTHSLKCSEHCEVSWAGNSCPWQKWSRENKSLSIYSFIQYNIILLLALEKNSEPQNASTSSVYAQQSFLKSCYDTTAALSD
jgi:hypothetical protein